MHTLKVDLTPKLKPLELDSIKGVAGNMPFSGSSGSFAGRRPRRVFRGKGLEFEKFREFAPGDDASMIDWKASLRSWKMLVKVYTEEQNKDIVFAMDTSASMVYSSFGKMKCEYAAELVASLSYALAESGDNIGLAMFSDHVRTYLRPGAGNKHHHAILQELKNPKNYDGNFDFEKSLMQIASLMTRKTMILLFSDFIGLKHNWERVITTLSEKYEFIGFCILDPADLRLPEQEEQVVIAHPYAQREMIVDPGNIAQEYELHNRQRLRHLETVFTKTVNRFLVLVTNRDFKRDVERFLLG